MPVDYAIGAPKFTFYLYDCLISTSSLIIALLHSLSHNSMNTAGSLPGFAHYFILDAQSGPGIQQINICCLNDLGKQVTGQT